MLLAGHIPIPIHSKIQNGDHSLDSALLHPFPVLQLDPMLPSRRSLGANPSDRRFESRMTCVD
jgi:hypothetical protein